MSTPEIVYRADMPGGPPFPAERETETPRQFFQNIFRKLDGLTWIDVDNDKSAETVSGEILGLAEVVNSMYEKLTPRQILADPDFWFEGLKEPEKKDIKWRLEDLNRISRETDYPLAVWNKAAMTPHVIPRYTDKVWGPDPKPTLSVFADNPVYKLGEKLTEELHYDGNEVFLPYLPLYAYLRQEWQSRFDRQTTPENQAKYIQFIYHIENIFMEEPPLVRSMVEELYHEWLESDIPGKVGIPGEPEEVFDKLTNSFSQLGLAAVSAYSAWSYTGRQMPKEFLDYLLNDEKRDKAMLLFNDIVGFSEKGKLIYPPQLLYIFRFLLPENLRLKDGVSLTEILDNLYENGRNLLDYVNELNFIVTSDKRSDEYKRHQKELLEGVNLQGTMLSVFSGPPVDALLKHMKFRFLGPLYTVDAAGETELFERAMAIPNEFRQDENPYTEKKLRKRTGRLIEKVNTRVAGAYPVEGGTWNHHLTTPLPDLAKVRQFLGDQKVTLLLNQRGGALYLTPSDELREIFDNISVLSAEEGSLYILTRGLPDRLVVDIGFQRNDEGRLGLKFMERTDCYYPSNSVLEFYMKGAFTEGRIKTGGREKIQLYDSERLNWEKQYRLLQKALLRNEVSFTIDMIGLLKNQYQLDLPETYFRQRKFNKILNPFDTAYLLNAVLDYKGLMPKNGDFQTGLIKKARSFIAYHIRKEIEKWPKEEDLEEKSVVLWLAQKHPDILFQLVENLSKNLYRYLNNVRSFQTLRRDYGLFYQEFSVALAKYFGYRMGYRDIQAYQLNPT
ncbi:MAG: hypothetical protein UV73_C0008G0031 [Candidatus Gottesmanbacteria bacterium GW2011_GWA2_43_14]|uniref:Uncharacterized protein n=1 Tax=Candidatus Gottesmanbacteria bacterium GW2011_GWA2_43_14 TaxID=1618443 RepID=A0A0G1FR51_9BACT|nr:MAG: hypothetical protein UV73_C0008G0031 [Candidatus Gottesmanbacteria bacterium GW2011_GWA2_43_14]